MNFIYEKVSKKKVSFYSEQITAVYLISEVEYVSKQGINFHLKSSNDINKRAVINSGILVLT